MQYSLQEKEFVSFIGRRIKSEYTLSLHQKMYVAKRMQEILKEDEIKTFKAICSFGAIYRAFPDSDKVGLDKRELELHVIDAEYLRQTVKNIDEKLIE